MGTNDTNATPKQRRPADVHPRSGEDTLSPGCKTPVRLWHTVVKPS